MTIEEINNQFKLPIEYINKENLHNINDNIINDLELQTTVDSESDAIYNHVLSPRTEFGKTTLKKWTQHYTDKKEFLLDTQKLLENFKTIECNDNNDKLYSLWDNVTKNESFKSDYLFFDWDFLEKFNHYAFCLEMLCLYTMTSPIFSIIFPILMLFVPLAILKFRGAEITVDSYTTFLKRTLRNHTLGIFFNDFTQLSLYQTLYSGFSLFIFFFNIYQNVLTCFRFHTNIKQIQEDLNTIKDFIFNTTKKLDNLLTYTTKLETYSFFNEKLETTKLDLTEYYNSLVKIKPFQYTFSKIVEIGEIMRLYYYFHNDKKLSENILYSLGLHGYIENLEGIQDNIKNKYINFCKFTNKNNIYKKTYYPALKNFNPVKNNVSLNKNMIITGPNAAGKTTIIKSIIINTILSQQIGLGFYKSAKINPYQYIHCYINIPDTSGRDSLFQAEARRCKNIINDISKYENTRQLCIFDELFSGTNPYEAVSAAFSYTNYLSQKPNIKFILTTHFINLCDLIKENKTIQNFYMDADINDDKMNYTYLCKKGVSNIKGGIQVLRELQYPNEIINESEKIIKIL